MTLLMKKVFVVLIVALYSCNTKVEAIFEITNSTNEKIDSLTIQPDDNINNFIEVNKNSKVTFKTDMKKTPIVDGSYSIYFKIAGKTRGLNFGYYSNGFPDESLTKIDIQKDTIIFKQEYNKKY